MLFKSSLYTTTVDILTANDWDVDRAMPELVAKVHGDKQMLLAALMHAATIDPVTGERAPYHDEQLTHTLMHLYAKNLAYEWNNRKEVGNGSDI